MRSLENKLQEKERNEKHVLSQIANLTAQAQAAALEKYAPMIALSRSLAISTGHIVVDPGAPKSTSRPHNNANAVSIPDSAKWKDMPKAPITAENKIDWSSPPTRLA